MVDLQSKPHGDSDPPSWQLELRNVTSGYGKTDVLHGVNLRVELGSIVAILGANGAGKTTTLRTIAGIVRPSSGTVVFDGVDITAKPAHHMVTQGMCMIPEGRGIFRSLTVHDNLRLYAGRRVAHTEAYERVLEMFPALRSRMRTLAGNLSGGQQQMLALARAYLQSPQLVLLDEVSMGLAPLIVDEIFAVLRTLADSGTTMVIVEQYLSRALDMAESVVLLQKGSVAFHGPAAELDEETVLHKYLGVEFAGSGQIK